MGMAHILGHLTPHQRELVPWLLLPLTLDEIAERAGYSGRTSVEHHWHGIIYRLLLSGGGAVTRLALLRLVVGMDPCWCKVTASA